MGTAGSRYCTASRRYSKSWALILRLLTLSRLIRVPFRAELPKLVFPDDLCGSQLASCIEAACACRLPVAQRRLCRTRLSTPSNCHL
ncbi:uncharacterized protein CC84DRAFT_158280 [Paraphaeosphaeria sporulosa]|uniref:Uncharacterized protein n=1 Tax=Paraphaeosphaeria sporulosa TaxID=1460663 RepID=A0A177CYY6_9PLEO|nr:uncharacterized protein CC84DRAFT_158280 [Paraphaeosphaeria sporulosa]OAG12755.1 hypothetical protein CC84DRAFT_158280 [Paraphaeosphaeria sporulosa]